MQLRWVLPILSIVFAGNAFAQGTCLTDPGRSLFIQSPLYYTSVAELGIDSGCFASFPLPDQGCEFQRTRLQADSPLQTETFIDPPTVPPLPPGAHAFCYLSFDNGLDGACREAARTGVPCAISGNVEAIAIQNGGPSTTLAAGMLLMLIP